MNGYFLACWRVAEFHPGYRVLIDMEVHLVSQENHSGIVTEVSEDGREVKVWMLSGEFIGQEMWTPTTDIIPMQPGIEFAIAQGLVKLLDGPFVGRVGKLLHILEGTTNKSIGVVKFGSGEMKTFDMSLVAVVHAPRASCF